MNVHIDLYSAYFWRCLLFSRMIKIVFLVLIVCGISLSFAKEKNSGENGENQVALVREKRNLAIVLRNPVAVKGVLAATIGVTNSIFNNSIHDVNLPPITRKIPNLDLVEGLRLSFETAIYLYSLALTFTLTLTLFYFAEYCMLRFYVVISNSESESGSEEEQKNLSWC